MAAMTSKRQFDRAPVLFKVDYRTVDRFFTDFAENLSAGGMFISTPRPLDPGSTIIIEFILPVVQETLKVKAEVMWVRKRAIAANERRGMGVRFEDLSQEDRERIDAIVSTLRRVP